MSSARTARPPQSRLKSRRQLRGLLLELTVDDSRAVPYSTPTTIFELDLHTATWIYCSALAIAGFLGLLFSQLTG